MTNIPYGSNQLNKNKGGCNPDNYYIPDFSYYYTINELNLEIIGVEDSSYFCPNEIGGGHGNTKTFDNCSPNGNYINGIEIGCNYLSKINNASESLLIDRAKTSDNHNFIIMQHYPQQSSRILSLFTHNRANTTINNNNDRIWSVFGHSHKQECRGHDKYGSCNEILSGGGGGCCIFEETIRGFYVIGFDNNGTIIQPYSIDDPNISCMYPCINES